MRLPLCVVTYLRNRLMNITKVRGPDEIIAPGDRWRASRNTVAEMPHNPFLNRWFIGGKKSKWCNRYLHCFVRNDEDRALHDHPWFNFSIILDGEYIEHTIDAGGVHKRIRYSTGDVKFRSPWFAHRVELIKDAAGHPKPCWSLFITGPVMRKRWGFHCPETGWRSSQDFHINGGCE